MKAEMDPLEALYAWADAEGVSVEWEHLDGIEGHYDHAARTIYLDRCLVGYQERSVLAHEINHALHADRPTRDAREIARRERRADEYAARRLITPQDYAAAERAVGDSHPGALAIELDVCTWVVEAWQHAARVGRGWTRHAARRR